LTFVVHRRLLNRAPQCQNTTSMLNTGTIEGQARLLLVEHLQYCHSTPPYHSLTPRRQLARTANLNPTPTPRSGEEATTPQTPLCMTTQSRMPAVNSSVWTVLYYCVRSTARKHLGCLRLCTPSHRPHTHSWTLRIVSCLPEGRNVDEQARL
jgi:hypothetical protein